MLVFSVNIVKTSVVLEYVITTGYEELLVLLMLVLC